MSKFENLSKEIWVIAIGIVQYLLGGVDAWLKALYGGEVINGGPYRSIFSIYNSDMGVTFNYVHMADHQFTVGDIVAAGEFIGRHSNVGDAVSSHLHFEVTEGSTIANPDTENVNTNMASILPYGYMFG